MTGRKRAGLFVVAAGVVLLAGAGFLWRNGSPDARRIATSSAAFEDSLKHVHAQLVATNLKYRALIESETSIPDTLKVYGAGKMMQMGNGYAKVIRKLETTETDIKIEMASLKRNAERERAAMKRRTLPLAGAGAAAFLIGIILTALPNRRVGA